jgi:type I restriction enzyme S subunit
MSDEKFAIPENWAKCSFGDLARIRNGFAFKSSEFSKSPTQESIVPLVRQSQLKGTKVDLSDAVYVSSAYLKTHKQYALRKGDIIIGMSGSIGHICEFDLDAIALQNQRTGKVEMISKNATDPKFFGLFLASIENTLRTLSKGMGVQNISSKDIEELNLYLPPLNEQKRIVEKIEELFSELDKGIESLKAAREQLKIYRQSVLKHAFEGKLTEGWRAGLDCKFETSASLLEKIEAETVTNKNSKLKTLKGMRPFTEAELSKLPDLPNGWAWVRYGDLCSVVRNGISDKPEGITGTAIFRISAVRPMQFDLKDIRNIDNEDGRYDSYFLQKGDLVFTRYNGSRAYVGVCAEYKSDGTHLFPDKLIQTRIAAASINTGFLEKALNCGASRKFIESLIRTTAGQSGVSGSDVKAIPVPICDIAEQELINQHLDEELSRISQIEIEIEVGLQKSEALRQSILKTAFSGKLVPQDPNDEPASVLLERIRSDQGNTLARRGAKK